jgi:hypothetical protein
MEQPVRRTLRIVGCVLIFVGCLDIGVMIYSITHSISYRSSFDIFAVIAGIFLMRGNIKAAGIVRGFAIFFLAAFLGLVAAMPFIIPPDLMLTEFRLAPGGFALDFAVSIVLFATLLWVVRELGREPVQVAYINNGGKPRRTKFYIAAGCLFPAGLVLVMHILLTSDRAHRAEQLAEQRLGTGYKFRTTSMNVSSNSKGTKVRATVTAWNHADVQHVPEEWTEQ